MRALTAYDWPGNVRELANEVQRALVLATAGERLDLTELSEKVTGTPAGTTEWKKHSALRDAIEAVERELIERANETFHGNKTHMSEQLGISRWTLLQKMRAYGMETGNGDSG